MRTWQRIDKVEEGETSATSKPAYIEARIADEAELKHQVIGRAIGPTLKSFNPRS